MRNLLRLSILSLLIIGGTISLNAQNYKSSVGVRLGSPTSLSYKLFISESNAVEVFLNYRTDRRFFLGNSQYGWRRIGIGASYQVHEELDDVLDGLMWYYGGGVSVLYYNYDYNYYNDTYRNVSIGLQGNVGLDYTFEDKPLNISIDWVPTFYINGFINGLGADYGAISIRYILGGQ